MFYAAATAAAAAVLMPRSIITYLQYPPMEASECASLREDGCGGLSEGVTRAENGIFTYLKDAGKQRHYKRG